MGEQEGHWAQQPWLVLLVLLSTLPRSWKPPCVSPWTPRDEPQQPPSVKEWDHDQGVAQCRLIIIIVVLARVFFFLYLFFVVIMTNFLLLFLCPMPYALCVLMLLINLLLLFLLSQVATRSGGLSYYSDLSNLWSAVCGMVPRPTVTGDSPRSPSCPQSRQTLKTQAYRDWRQPLVTQLSPVTASFKNPGLPWLGTALGHSAQKACRWSVLMSFQFIHC